MLSGSQRCLRIKKQSCAVSKLQLNEPLLFLYPRWFRIAVATHQQSDKTSIPSPKPVWLDLDHSSSIEKSGLNSTSTTLSPYAWIGPAQTVSQNSSGAPRKRIETAPLSRNESTDTPQNPEAKSASASLRRVSAKVSKSWNNMIMSKSTSEIGATTLSLDCPSSGMTSMTQTEDVQTHLPKLRIWRAHQSAYRQVLAKSPEAHAKSIQKKDTKKLHDPAEIEWNEPISLLAQLIHRPKQVLGQRLELHRNTVFHLTGSINTNTWFHQVGLGCEVRVLDDRASDRDKVVVSLVAMTRARRLTREYLLEADREITNAASWRLSPKDDPKLICFVLSSLKWHHRTKDVRRADAVEYPRNWSIRSFAEVVWTLTTMQIPHQLKRELYGGPDTHNRTVAGILESLFSDPRSAPFISSRALNYALHFTCKHTEVSDTSKFLFEKAKSVGLSLQADTFNILIEQSLRQNKLNYYRYLLAGMRQMGVVPDGMTWVALLRVTKSRTARRSILQHLRQKWPKDSALWRQVALELVSTDFAQLVRLEKSFDYFVDFMDQSLPSVWLSARCINRMLNVCAKKKLWDIVPRILELGERRGGYLNTATQSLLLKVFQERGSIRDSIDLLESHFAKTVGRDSAIAIPTIFMTAWNSRFYNVCRVLWRYAAVHGIITSAMQTIVGLSLIKNHSGASESASHLWRVTAGKVIVGMDLDTTGLAAEYQYLNQENLREPMKVLAQWTPNDGLRQEQLALAHTIFQRDLGAYKRFWHFRSQQLCDLLRKAYEMDCDWMHNEKVRRYSDLSWMIESAIDVPLQPLADPSISPRHLLWLVEAETGMGARQHLAPLDRLGD